MERVRYLFQYREPTKRLWEPTQRLDKGTPNYYMGLSNLKGTPTPNNITETIGTPKQLDNIQNTLGTPGADIK